MPRVSYLANKREDILVSPVFRFAMNRPFITKPRGFTKVVMVQTNGTNAKISWGQINSIICPVWIKVFVFIYKFWTFDEFSRRIFIMEFCFYCQCEVYFQFFNTFQKTTAWMDWNGTSTCLFNPLFHNVTPVEYRLKILITLKKKFKTFIFWL